MTREGWEVVKLGDLCKRIIGGGTPSKANPLFWGGDILWATVKDMPKNTFTLYETQDKITIEGLQGSSANIVPKGNLIISARMGVGRCFIAGVDMAINQDMKGLFLDYTIVDTFFILYRYISQSKEIEALGSGTTVKGITLDQLRNLEISLPPLAEQERIASILSAYDDLIENNTRRIALLEQMAQTLYRQWFVEYKFPGYQDVEMVESGTEFGMIPQGREVKKIGDVVDVIEKGPTLKYVENSIDGIPVLNQKCVRNGEIELKDIQYAKELQNNKTLSYMKMYDILINSMGVGTLGRVGRNLSIKEKMIIHNCITFIRANQNIIKQNVLYYQIKFFEQDFINLGIGSTGQTTLSLNTIKSFNILVPSIKVQEILNEILTKKFDLIGVIKKQNQSLKEQRDVLLRKLIG